MTASSTRRARRAPPRRCRGARRGMLALSDGVLVVRVGVAQQPRVGVMECRRIDSHSLSIPRKLCKHTVIPLF